MYIDTVLSAEDLFDVIFYNNYNNGFGYNLGFFGIALFLSELTIPLFIFAWIIKIIFFVILFILALVLRE